MRRTWALLAGSSLLAWKAPPALAQGVPDPSTGAPEVAQERQIDPAAPPQPEAEGDLNTIVVTGTTAPGRTVLESSVAVTVVTREEFERKAPSSLAEALQLVPGIYVEASGGEVSNNFSVRGLAGGAQQFIQLSEDGLPIFYTNALADTILKPELAIQRFEAIRGGTSGVLTVNGAGATINWLTRKPTDIFEASVRATTSDYETARGDFWVGGPLAEDWLASASGFYRVSDGVRDVGFTADDGGIFRASLTRTFEDGYFTLRAKLVDESNTFLLPIPLQGVDNPRGIPGIDPTEGTLVSRDNAVQTVRTGPFTGRLTQVNDLTEGVRTKTYAIGYEFEKEVATDLILRSKGRFTDFENDFNAVFNFDNATLVPAVVRLDPARNADVALLLDRFGSQGAVRAGLQVVSTGEIIAGDAALNALNGNGLTADSITVKNRRDVREFVNDLSLTWQTDRNTLTGGLLFFSSRVEDGNIGASTFISEVTDNPNRLDIVALDANNNVVGYLTENGLLNYGTWGEGNAIAEFDSYNFYANDEFEVTDRLRVDAGVRIERYELFRREGISISGERNPDGTTTDPRLIIPGAFGPGGEDVDNVVANNYYAQFGGGIFSGNFREQRAEYTNTSWTVGGNYTLTDDLAFYARYASSYQNQAQNPVTEIAFTELGARYQSRSFSASATGFYTQFFDFLFSRQLPGDVLPTEFQSDIEVLGVEFDLLWRPVDFFQVQGIGVVQNSEIVVGDDQGTGNAQFFDGNQPERTPELNFTLIPTLFLPNDLGEVSVSWQHVGKRFSDIANSLELPAYDVISASLAINITDQLVLRAVGDNLTDEIGLTEGNPRSGFTENPGVSDFFYARPILGRSFRFSLTYDF